MQDIILGVAEAYIPAEAESGDILPQKSKMKNDSDQLSGTPSFHFCQQEVTNLNGILI